MIRSLQLLVLLIVAVCVAGPVQGQQNPPSSNSSPKIVTMQAGVSRLLADLEYLTKLAGQKGEKAWPDIKSAIVDTFLMGADHQRPLRLDILLGEKEERYLLSIPVDPSQKFDSNHPMWVNIELFGLKPKSLGGGLYRTDPQNFDGYMRFAENYITFASQKNDLPSDMPNPLTALQPLLDRNYDVGAEISNPATGQENRRESMAAVRENLLAALTQNEDESAREFELRKLGLSQQIDEMERFFVESQHIIGGWITDTDAKEGRFELELTAIPETSLAQSVQLLGQNASRFAGIPQSQNSILSGRLNHPLDEMRQTHLVEFFEKSNELALEKIEADQALSAEQKAAATQLSTKWFNLLATGAKNGLADGFMEATQTQDGKRTFVAGSITPDSQAILEMLELLPQARPGSAVEMNVEQYAEIGIHKLTVSEEARPLLTDFFGEVPEVYVGTGEGTVWVSAGAGALPALKQAIDQSQGTAADGLDQNVFVRLFAKVGPWVEFLDKRRGGEGDRVALRREAIELFKKGDDTLVFEMRRVDDKAVVTSTVKEGILRFVGSVIADASKEYLQ